MEVDFQIKCPICRNPAEFTYAKSIRIKQKDIDYFSNSKTFKVCKTKGWSSRKTYYFTLHYPYLMPDLENITDLPEQYSFEHWQKRLCHGTDCPQIDEGVVVCSSCKARQKHLLKWPADAYFQLDYKGHTLWAYDREYALKLRDYIASNTRQKRHPTSSDDYIFQDRFLRKIPERFQTKRARDEIVKKLEKLLST